MDTEQIRRRLEDERRELIDQREALAIDVANNSTDSGLSQHMADDATDLFLRDRNLAVRRNAEDLIAQIDGALGRLRDGSYGTCERCGAQIPAERLEARPYAAYCIACQSALEQAG